MGCFVRCTDSNDVQRTASRISLEMSMLTSNISSSNWKTGRRRSDSLYSRQHSRPKTGERARPRSASPCSPPSVHLNSLVLKLEKRQAHGLLLRVIGDGLVRLLHGLFSMFFDAKFDSHMYAAAPAEPTRLTQAFVRDALYIWSPPTPAVNLLRALARHRLTSP